MILLVVCPVFLSVYAGDGPQPVFYLPLDGDTRPKVAKGDPAPTITGQLQFVEGKVGKAVVIDEEDVLACRTQGNFSTAAGTVCIWVNPIVPLDNRGNWDRFFDMTYQQGNDNTIRALCSRANPQGSIYTAICSDGKRYGVTGGLPPNWPVGEWHHLAFTWGPSGTRLYFDGDLAGANLEYTPPVGCDEIFVIGNDKSGKFSAKAAIDEVFIFDRALTSSEIRRVAGLPAYTDAEAPNLLPNSSFEAGYPGWTFWWQSDVGTKWEIVEGESVHGHRSLMVDRTNCWGPGAHRFIIHGPWLQLEPGQKFCFSLHMKASKPNFKVGLMIQNGTKQHLLEKGIVTPQGIWKSFEVGAEWNRYDVTGELPPAYKDAYRVSIHVSDSGGKVWMDSLQFASGDMREYVPYHEMEMACYPDRFGSLYDKGEEVKVTEAVFNNAKEARAAQVKYMLSDPHDFAVKEGILKFDLPSGERVSETISIRPGLVGQYEYDFDLLDPNGTLMDRQTLAFGVVKSHLGKDSPEDSPFGVTCGTQNLEFKLARMRMIGIKHLRPGVDLAWPWVEPKKGEFQLDAMARFHEMMRAQGLTTLPTLGSTPKWARRKEEEPAWREGRIPPENPEDWSNYALTVATYFKGKQKEWQIMNEPNGKTFFSGTPQEYAELLKLAYGACKQADPTCKVFGGSMAGLNERSMEWAEEVFKAGGLDYMDGLAFHPYRESPPESLIDDLRKIVALMNKYGGEKPMYYTEFGWSGTEDKRGFIPWFSGPGGGNAPSEHDQACNLVRSWIVSLSEGVDRLYWYQWNGERSGCGPDLSALIRPDSHYTPKKAVLALNALISEIEGTKYLRALSMQAERQYGFEFQKGDRRIAALWSAEGRSQYLIEPFQTRRQVEVIEVRDMYGNPLEATRKLLLDASPIYVETKGGL